MAAPLIGLALWVLLGGAGGGLVGYHLLRREDREELEDFAEQLLRTHLGQEHTADQARRRRVKRLAEQISAERFGKPVKELTSREVRSLRALVLARLELEDG